MFLNATNKSIVAILTSAPATTAPTFQASFCGGAGSQGSNVGTITEVETIIVPTPSNSESFDVESILIANTDSAAVEVTLSLKVTSTNRRIWKGTLGVGDVFTYADGEITVVDNIGREKTSSTIALSLADGDNLILGSTTGSKIGTATTQKLGFWNATPIVQPVGAAQAAVVTTAATQITPYGFETQAQADNLVALANAIRTALVNAGLIKGAA